MVRRGAWAGYKTCGEQVGGRSSETGSLSLVGHLSYSLCINDWLNVGGGTLLSYCDFPGRGLVEVLRSLSVAEFGGLLRKQEVRVL